MQAHAPCTWNGARAPLWVITMVGAVVMSHKDASCNRTRAEMADASKGPGMGG